MARNKNKNKGRNKGGGGRSNNNSGSSSNKGSGGGGSQQSKSSSTPTRQQQAKAAANMSVKQRRTAAKEAGVGLKDFKAGRTGANAVARRDAQRETNRSRQGNQQGQQQQTQGNTFTTAAGYTMEKGGYRQGAQDILDQYKKDAPLSGMVSNAGIEGFDKDGYLGYDSTKAQFQNNTALKEAGYKAGDMLWKPGALDNLNGRKLTGRIARITELGNYIPEYEHDAVNSSHRSTGNAGYAGEVGLGADQAAYNREYERNNDVATGQRNQQLEINGFETETQINDVSATQGLNQQSSAGLNDGMNENNNGFTNDYGNGYSTMPQMRLSNASTAEQAANPSFAQYDFSGNGSFSKKKSLSSGMNFSFNPGKFMQGQ